MSYVPLVVVYPFHKPRRRFTNVSFRAPALERLERRADARSEIVATSAAYAEQHEAERRILREKVAEAATALLRRQSEAYRRLLGIRYVRSLGRRENESNKAWKERKRELHAEVVALERRLGIRERPEILPPQTPCRRKLPSPAARGPKARRTYTDR